MQGIANFQPYFSNKFFGFWLIVTGSFLCVVKTLFAVKLETKGGSVNPSDGYLSLYLLSCLIIQIYIEVVMFNDNGIFMLNSLNKLVFI